SGKYDFAPSRPARQDNSDYSVYRYNFLREESLAVRGGHSKPGLSYYSFAHIAENSTKMHEAAHLRPCAHYPFQRVLDGGRGSACQILDYRNLPRGHSIRGDDDYPNIRAARRHDDHSDLHDVSDYADRRTRTAARAAAKD